MEIIALKECLQEMETGKPFTITFVKADRKRNTGGELVTYENCQLYQKKSGDSKPGTGKQKAECRPAVFSLQIPDSKNPNHYLHSTRNVILANGKGAAPRIRKIHIRLIVQFNGARVVY